MAGAASPDATGAGEVAAERGGDHLVEVPTAELHRLREDRLGAVADRDLGRAPAEVDVERGQLGVACAAVDVVEGVHHRLDLAVHRDELQAAAAEEVDMAHRVLAGHREREVLAAGLAVAAGLEDRPRADDERAGRPLQGGLEQRGDRAADVGILGRRHLHMLDPHEPAHRRAGHAAPAEAAGADRVHDRVAERLEPRLERLRPQLVGHADLGRGDRDRPLAGRRLQQLHRRRPEVDGDGRDRVGQAKERHARFPGFRGGRDPAAGGR
jgi:hypothetical protein